MTTIKCPEGVELDLIVYLTSPSMGANVRLAVRGLSGLPPFNAVCDAAPMVKAHQLDKLANDWRFMTRAEMVAYKAEEDAG